MTISQGSNQIEISITGDGWKLHSPETETLSVVSERLGEFVGDAATRHWGAFAGISNYEAALERVETFTFGGAELVEIEANRFSISSALRRYLLSDCFTYGNLGVDHAVSVRDQQAETVFWRTRAGKIGVAVIPNAKFDAAIAGFVAWASSQTS